MTRDDDVFGDALELPTSERKEFLGRACAGDKALRGRVEAMLALHDEAPGFLDVPLLTRTAGSPEEKPGDQIGRYKLLQKIGEGGCGSVYMAEQTEPVRRRVAIKVIKLGMDTKAVIARFGAEQQALAMMDHPNIAKVLDGGVTDKGRPFFVMELVRGVPITKYCDEQLLPTSARLELFTQVCRAIAHAHQHGIIHRDIKPSNILVSLHDGVPVPKVIDFGIAKATQGRLTDATLFTAFEQFIGTPAYISPEQAEMSSLDVDTRSDIYSLGVLLYELLTGRTPFESKELIQAGLDEMRRQIREVEPPRPSTRLRTLEKEGLTITAEHRHTDAPKLIALIHGDLDWIVMRCLEKDRTRRYATADGLAADIVRHLGHEPVSARPPSPAYRLGKAIRRNKPAFGAAAVILIGACAWMLERRMSDTVRTPGQAAGASSTALLAPDQKSIAVLPFTNMSEDKDASAFFSDGMHDDIITNLALIRELRVVPRTTAMHYRDTSKTLRKIGEELQVAYILEGSVRRAGTTMRLTGKLINARTEEHVWAKSYDRDLSDIFAVQAALAQEIGVALRAAISPQEKSLLERRPTENLPAYDLYLKARGLRQTRGSSTKLGAARDLLERALQLDPNFVQGWTELSCVESLFYQFYGEPTPAQLGRAKAALDTAVRLAPDSPDVLLALGEYYYRCHLDFARSLEQFERLDRLRPNDPAGIALMAAVQRRQGKWVESLVGYRRAIQLDPGNFNHSWDLTSTLTAGRRFDEARSERRRLIERQPDLLNEHFDLAYLAFIAGGAMGEMDEFFRGLPAHRAKEAEIVALRKFWAIRCGDLTEAVRLDREHPDAYVLGSPLQYFNETVPVFEAIEMAVVFAAQGDEATARARLKDYPAKLRTDVDRTPDRPELWAMLGQMEALLGNKTEALRCARRAVELTPESRDAMKGAAYRATGPAYRATLAWVEAWTGQKDTAIAKYAQLLRTPYGHWITSASVRCITTIHVMKRDPHYAPLRGDPRFEALLSDPKNNAPLF